MKTQPPRTLKIKDVTDHDGNTDEAMSCGFTKKDIGNYSEVMINVFGWEIDEAGAVKLKKFLDKYLLWALLNRTIYLNKKDNE